jgi:hypothetical protein
MGTITMTSLDSFRCCKPLKVGSKTYAHYSLPTAEKNGLKGISRLPFSMKVLLENLLRNEDGRSVTKADIQGFAQWLKTKTSESEIPFRPARVLMQDFTGVPAVVDLAAMRDAMKQLGATDSKAMMLRFHAQTGGSTLTAQQPLNNISRVTVQTLAAVLGGTQSLHTNGYDEALSLPTEEAARIALRTQQIAAYESGIADTVDPLGGSYFVESLTDEVERKAWDYIHRIDEMGGAIAGWGRRAGRSAGHLYADRRRPKPRAVRTLRKTLILDETISPRPG